MKRGIMVLVISIILVLPLASAGFFDWVKGKVQMGPSETKEVAVTVGNAVPVVAVQSVTNPVITPGGTGAVNIIFRASDDNGRSNLDDSSVSLTLDYSGAGEATRIGTIAQCTPSNIDAYTKEYNCNINMLYYDEEGTWTIDVTIDDFASATGQDNDDTFSVPEMKEISLSAGLIAFPPTIPGGSNYVSSSDTTITNNGNYEVPSDGNFEIISQALVGETNNLQNISGGNFRSEAGVTPCTTGTALAENTAVAIVSVSLPKGASGNTEDVRHCLTLVPAGIDSQIYSTTEGGAPWTFQI